jgi:hypothetical protein
MILGMHRADVVCVCANLHTGRRAQSAVLCAVHMMKSLQVFVSLLFVATGLSAGVISMTPAAPVSDDILLSAIAEVETGNNSAMVGHSGERTRLQIAPETWVRFSHVPHAAAASHPQETDRVARAYLASIRTRLKSRGLPITPFFIAAAWNAGPGWSSLPSSTIAYAERVANLVAAARPVPVKAVPPVQPVQMAVAEPIPVISVEDGPAPSVTLALAQSGHPISSNSFALVLPSCSPVAAPKYFIARVN